ncbi:hypothetical protein ACFWNE_28770 [Streptomyces goshikiensis]|uniref:hypothetical protein n=1 Tax=Streptomyces goshikiensis TaxID=1942 RepID=UPI00365CE242
MIKRTAQAVFVVGTVLLSTGLAHADDAVGEASIRDQVGILTADIEQQNPHSSRLPAVNETLGMPRPGDDVPIEVDFTANEDSKTAQLDVTADQA